MHDPEEFAHRVRSRPYGPVEVVTGAVATWLHGPFLVLSVTVPHGAGVTVTAAGDDAGLAVDMVEFFEAAASGEAVLTDPGRVAVGRPAGSPQPVGVTGLRVAARDGRCRMIVEIGSVVVAAPVSQGDMAVHAETVRAWAAAVVPAGAVPAVGVQSAGRGDV
jgi:hypothetical protein